MKRQRRSFIPEFKLEQAWCLIRDILFPRLASHWMWAKRLFVAGLTNFMMNEVAKHPLPKR